MKNETENHNTKTETISISRSEYETLKKHNAELTLQVKWLMEQIHLARHRQFGASSEKSEYDQLNLLMRRKRHLMKGLQNLN